jgi:hypothetical protein
MKPLQYALAFALVVALQSHVAHGAEGTDVTLVDFKDGITGFRYLWQVPVLTLEHVPKWDVLGEDPPLTIRVAIGTAARAVRSALSVKTNLSLYSVSLEKHMLKNKRVTEVWVYHISFEAVPAPTTEKKPLLEILILMDGTVVQPTISRLSP